MSVDFLHLKSETAIWKLGMKCSMMMRSLWLLFCARLTAPWPRQSGVNYEDRDVDDTTTIHKRHHQDKIGFLSYGHKVRNFFVFVLLRLKSVLLVVSNLIPTQLVASVRNLYWFKVYKVHISEAKSVVNWADCVKWTGGCCFCAVR